MDDVEYRNRYEAGDMTEREELIYLKEENKKLREIVKSCNAYRSFFVQSLIDKIDEIIEIT